MTSRCKYCKNLNHVENYFCSSCKQLMYSPEYTIGKLLKAQEELERKHTLEHKHLKDQINKVKHYLLTKEQIEHVSAPVVKESEPILQPVDEDKAGFQEIIEKPEPVVLKEIVPEISEVTTHSIVNNANESFKAKENIKPVSPSLIERETSKLLEPLFDGLDLVKQVFVRYKKEGKLPILLMTIAGILAILIGFGYLMQLSFEYLGVYSGLVKVGLGFVSSAVIGIIGNRLYKKDTKYQEYSSALLSLMVILNYLLIYFLTNLSGFPMLSSAQIGFLLIVANTGLSIFLAFKYETKIIAVLSLIGGALTPFYLNESGNPDFYFGYLWILLVAANFIALRIKWYKLNYISFVLYLLIIEGAVFTDTTLSNLFIGFIHLYAYLFFYIVLFNKTKLKTELSQTDLIILSGNLTLFLLNVYTTISDVNWVGIIYLANGVVFAFWLVKGWKSIPKLMKVGLFVTIGTFVGLAIPFLFGQAVMGLFWSIEAILLIVLGFVFAMESIRKEGYIVLLIALFKLCLSAVAILENWGGGLVNEGFLNYIILGFVFSGLWIIGSRFKDKFTSLEVKIYGVFREIIPIWLSSIVFIIGYDLLGNYGLNIMVVSMFGLMVWHHKLKTKYTEYFAILHLGFFLVAYGLSVSQVNSTSFSDQLLFGQIGVLELLFSFWFIQYFYDKMGYQRSTIYQIVKGLRILFYVLLPLIFIKQIFKHYTPYFPMALWGGLLMSYGLFRKFKHNALFIEVNVIYMAAVGINVVMYTPSGIGVGILVLLSLLIFEEAYVKESFKASKFTAILTLIPYLVIGLFSYLLGKEGIEVQYVGFIISLLLGGFAYYWNKLEIVRVSYKIAVRLSFVFALITGLIVLVDKPEFLSFILLIVLSGGLGYILKIIKIDYTNSNKDISWGINAVIHQLLIIITYSVAILTFGLDIDGPAMTIFLVIHAIVLLFMGLKNQNKVMNRGSLILFVLALIKLVLHDIRDFSGMSKIIVLIVLGVLLLVASYGYVRVRNKYLPEDLVTESDDNDA